MHFYAEKIHSLRYQSPTLSTDLKGYTCPKRITISEPKSVNDLGIDMSDDTALKMHITRMAIKFIRFAGRILRTNRNRDE